MAAIFLPSLAYLGVGIVVVVVALIAAARARSPFVAIFRDALAVFAADPHLRLLPALMLAGLALLAAGVSVAARRWAAPLMDLGPEMYLLPFLLASVPAGLFVAPLDAALAHCFIERSAGRPAGLAEGIGRMLARLPRLLAFTALWCVLLVLIALVKYELERWLKVLFPRSLVLRLLIDFAFFSLETGIVMASYFMIVVMTREDVGPIEAMRRMLAIVKAEWGKTVGELLRLKVLDGGVMLSAVGVFLTAIMACAAWAGDPSRPTMPQDRLLALLIVAPMSLAVGVDRKSVV